MKKYKIYTIVLFLVILSGILIFIPKELVKGGDDIKIDYIIYNSQFGNEDAEYSQSRVLLKEYDDAEIIEALSRYKSQLTLSRSKSYSIKDCRLELHIRVNGKSKNLVLGNGSFESRGYGSFKRRIIDDEELLNELLKTLGK